MPRPLAVAALLLGCAAAPPLGAPEELFPLAAGRRWSYEIREGGRRTRLDLVREGGDVRSLEGERVRFPFVYGRPETMDHAAAKSIYAAASGGPREFYFDGWDWAIWHDPPIPLLPPRVEPGAVWIWEGDFQAGGGPETTTRARGRVVGVEEVTVPAGTFRAVRVETAYDDPPVTLTRWFARGVGLVRLDLGDGERGAVLLAAD